MKRTQRCALRATKGPSGSSKPARPVPATGHPAAQLLRQPQLPEHVLVGFDARLPLLLVLAKLSGIVCLRRRLYKHQPFPVEEISKEGNLHITWLRRPIVKIFVITGRFSAVITHGIIGSDSLKIHGDVFFDVAVIHVLDLKDDAFAKLVVSEPIPDILGRVSGFSCLFLSFLGLFFFFSFPFLLFSFLLF